MRIEFRQSVANDRGSYRAGQIVEVGFLPKGWRQWLEAGVIRLHPDDQTETAIAPVVTESAVVPRRRPRARRAPMAG